MSSPNPPVEGARPLPRPEPVEGPAVLSPQQARDLASLLDALACPVRQQILLALSADPLHVTALAGRTGIAQKSLSFHLAFLRNAGLVHDHRRGREVWYKPAPDRVRLQPHDDGGFTLTLTARGGGVSVTVAVMSTISSAPGAAGTRRDRDEADAGADAVGVEDGAERTT